MFSDNKQKPSVIVREDWKNFWLLF